MGCSIGDSNAFPLDQLSPGRRQMLKKSFEKLEGQSPLAAYPQPFFEQESKELEDSSTFVSKSVPESSKSPSPRASSGARLDISPMRSPTAAPAATRQPSDPPASPPLPQQGSQHSTNVVEVITHPCTLRYLGIQALGRFRSAGLLWSKVLNVDDVWYVLCCTLARQHGLFVPGASSSGWRSVFFQQLWPARSKWEGQGGLDQETTSFSIQVCARFRPGERGKEVGCRLAPRARCALHVLESHATTPIQPYDHTHERCIRFARVCARNNHRTCLCRCTNAYVSEKQGK